MFEGGNEEKGRMNDVYIIDLSTMVKCVCVCVSAWACSRLCVYLFISVCCNGQTLLYVVTVRVCQCLKAVCTDCIFSQHYPHAN